MGKASSSRPKGGSVPVPLMIIAAVSISAIVAVSSMHLALGPQVGSNGRSAAARARLLLQGDQPEPGLHPDVGARAGGGSDQIEGMPRFDDTASPSSGSSRSGGAFASADAYSSSLALEQPVEQLTADADLAAFAAPGTHCVVTPAHSKVALLFLTHGDLPHDLVWTAWMREARGLLPRSSLAGEDAFCLKQCNAVGTCVQQCGRAAACNPLCTDALRRRLGPGRSPSVLQQQHLFSVYVHARPTLKDYPEGSIFTGRLIPDRQITKPGTHAMAAAAKKLVEVAVLDPRNAWFVLVGDTTVPLYHPALMWQQLMHESKSRLDACQHPTSEEAAQRQYSPDMGSDRFRPDQHWRTSGQWFALNRKHADLVALDQEVASLFARHCYVGFDEQLKRQRDCISDEHYVPSLLAAYGLDNETTCDSSGGTYSEWQLDKDAPGGKRARLFQPGHVTPELIARMRQTLGGSPGGDDTSSQGKNSTLCGSWAAATRAAQEGFVDVGSITPDSCPSSLGSTEYLQHDGFAGAELDPCCKLLGRKFSSYAAKWVHRVYRSCTAQLGVLPCSQRLTDRDTMWWA